MHPAHRRRLSILPSRQRSHFVDQAASLTTPHTVDISLEQSCTRPQLVLKVIQPTSNGKQRKRIKQFLYRTMELHYSSSGHLTGNTVADPNPHGRLGRGGSTRPPPAPCARLRLKTNMLYHVSHQSFINGRACGWRIHHRGGRSPRKDLCSKTQPDRTCYRSCLEGHRCDG